MQIVLGKPHPHKEGALYIPCFFDNRRGFYLTGKVTSPYCYSFIFCAENDPILYLDERGFNEKYLSNVKSLSQKLGSEYSEFRYFIVAIGPFGKLYSAFTNKHPYKAGLWQIRGLPPLPGEYAEEGRSNTSGVFGVASSSIKEIEYPTTTQSNSNDRDSIRQQELMYQTSDYFRVQMQMPYLPFALGPVVLHAAPVLPYLEEILSSPT